MLRLHKIALVVGAMICASICALESPSEQVGARACSRLALRLVDRLLEACDFYVHDVDDDRNQFNIDTNDTRLMGANRKSQVDVAKRRTRTTKTTKTTKTTTTTQLVDYLRTTKPMDWMERPHDDHQCWLEAIKWLRNQLFSARLQLMARNDDDDVTLLVKRLDDRKWRPNKLAQLLATFGQLAGHLSDVRRESLPVEVQVNNNNETQRKSRAQLALEFVREVIEIMAELQAEASVKSHKQRSALEVIKKHYAYLTQIVTSFDLLFGDEDWH